MDKKKNIKTIIFVSLLYSSSLIFYSRLPIIITIVVSFFYVCFLYIRLLRNYNNKETLYLCSILLIPTSTVSIIGLSCSMFPLSWFHILVIILFIKVVLQERVKKFYFALLSFFIGYVTVLSFITDNVFEAFKQILTISLFLSSFIIGVAIKKEPSNDLLETSVAFYICSTISFGVQIILQWTFINRIGIIIGHYGIMGRGRIAYAGLMGDYSFATLYLATGIMMALICYLDWSKINIIELISIEIFLLFTIIIVTSRTGIVAFAIVLVAYSLYHLKSIGRKTITLIAIGFTSIPIVVNRLLSVRGGQDLLDSSGRLPNYSQAISYFLKNPIWGVGLGVKNLTGRFNIGLPHNFFIQYLLQMGIIGTVVLLLFFGEFIINDINKNSTIKWVFWIVAVGSMFIPDVFSSRFYYVIVIMCMLPEYRSCVYE